MDTYKLKQTSEYESCVLYFFSETGINWTFDFLKTDIYTFPIFDEFWWTINNFQTLIVDLRTSSDTVYAKWTSI